MKKYYLTQEQFDLLEHYKRMFELNAETIRDLCSSEKTDIVYGFELGQTYNHLRECFSEMYGLCDNIQKQIINKRKNVKKTL
jgi:hypothetical protein